MAQKTYEECLDLINQVIKRICHRNYLSAADADDFGQEVHLKLLAERTIEKYQGRSALRTFLTVVLQNVYRDFRIKEWGKWRPSMEAKRLGPLAELLEKLIMRDGLSFEAAYETLTTNYGVTTSRAELEAIVARLPLRFLRRTQGEEALAAIPDAGPPPDVLMQREEIAAHAERVCAVLERLLQRLDPQDRLIIRWRYEDGMTVVNIATLIAEDHKRVFRRIDKIVQRLRKWFDEEGIDPQGLFDDEPWKN